MPIRHRANLSRPNEPHRCPKDLHARLRDPKCRKEMKDIPDPQPQPTPQPRPPVPPTPPPTPTPTPIIPIKPIPSPPIPTPRGGGGGLTPAEITAITGGSLLGAAAIGIGAATAISQMKGASGYEPVAGSEGTEMTPLGSSAEAEGGIVQAELAPIAEGEASIATGAGQGTEMTTLGSSSAATSAEQAAGTTAERQSVLSGARAATTTIPTTEGTPEAVDATDDDLLTALGKGAGGEGWDGSAGQAGMTLAKVKEASPTYVNPEEDPTITGEADATPAAQTATAIDSGELAADTSAVSSVDSVALADSAAAGEAAGASLSGEAAAAGAGLGAEAAAESTGLALGPEAIPAVFAAVAVTAIASFAPEIVSAITGGSSDYYYGLKHAERYGDNWDSVSDSLLTSAAAIKDPTQQKDALNYVSTLDKANSDGLEIVKWQDEATDQLNITAQKGVKSLALAVAKYQNDPDAFKGQDPRVLSIEGLNPIMAYGANGAVLNPTTGKYQPVASYADIKDIDQTLAATSASLLKETQDNTADDRGITAAKMDTIVANTYTDDDLLPTSTQNIYLSNQGNEATNIDTSVLSTQSGIMNTVGTSSAALAYIGTLQTPAVTATTPPTTTSTTPTTGGTTAQTPSSSSSSTAATTAAAPTTGGTTPQIPASTTTSSTTQGTALSTESSTTQKTQNK